MTRGEMIFVEKDVLKMVSRQGFIEVFWRELAEARKVNVKISHARVFSEMNEKYFNVFGVYRYSSYDVFKQILNSKTDRNGENINPYAKEGPLPGTDKNS